MTLASGTRLGRYEIRHKLGSGGMGEVYLAWDPDLEREIAVAEPFFRPLRATKRLEVCEGTHMPAPEVLVPILSGWLDETLGPVEPAR